MSSVRERKKSRMSSEFLSEPLEESEKTPEESELEYPKSYQRALSQNTKDCFEKEGMVNDVRCLRKTKQIK